MFELQNCKNIYRSPDTTPVKVGDETIAEALVSMDLHMSMGDETFKAAIAEAVVLESTALQMADVTPILPLHDDEESDIDDDIADKDYELPTPKISTFKPSKLTKTPAAVISEKSKTSVPLAKTGNAKRELLFPSSSKTCKPSTSRKTDSEHTTSSHDEDSDEYPIERVHSLMQNPLSSRGSSTSTDVEEANVDDEVPSEYESVKNPLIPPHEDSDFVHCPGYERTHKNIMFDYFIYDQTDPKFPTAKCICKTKIKSSGPIACGKVLMMTKSCSAGPITHLKAYHPHALEELKERREKWANHVKAYKAGLARRMDEKEGRTPGKRPRLDGKNEHLIKFKVRGPEQLRWDMLMMVQLVVGGIPFHFVDTEAFKNFWREWDPRVNLKCSSTFAKSKLPLLYNQVESVLFKRLRNECKSSPAMSFTVDGWTSKALDKYMGITGHIITKDWVLERYAIACCPQDGRSTGANIAAVIDDVLDKIGLPEGTTKIITTDNANNMKSAATKSTLVSGHLGCIDHTLQLIVNAGLKLPTVQPAIQACKWLVAKTHYAAEYKEWIKRMCDEMDGAQLVDLPGDDDIELEVTYTKFINSCETRYNT